MLYEEKRVSKFMLLLALPGFIGLSAGLWATYVEGEGFEIMLAIFVLLILILIDVMTFKIEINENEIRLRGTIGLFVRKTIKIDEIISFDAKTGWVGCWAPVRFNFPAKGCIVIHRKGWDVAFTTDNPEEIALILTTLGVSRAA